MTARTHVESVAGWPVLRQRRLHALLMVCLLCTETKAQTASFQSFGLPSAAVGVSADGSVVAVNANGEACKWTNENGSVCFSQVYYEGTYYDFDGGASGVSADGSTLAGEFSLQARSVQGNFAFEAQSCCVVDSLGLSGNNSWAYGVSGTGSVVVGQSGGLAFQWTSSGGTVSLCTGVAYSVSSDGSVVVGYDASDMQAFRWTTGTGLVGLGYLPATSNSEALAVSLDGTAIVGYSGTQAFRWEDNCNGMIGLGYLPGTSFTSANAVSADGSVVVGSASTGSVSVAFIWDAAHGMQNLQSVLTNENGLTLTGWKLQSATGVSSNGQFIVGTGINSNGQTEAWIAQIANISTNSCQSLGTWAVTIGGGDKGIAYLNFDGNCSFSGYGITLGRTNLLTFSGAWNVTNAKGKLEGNFDESANGSNVFSATLSGSVRGSTSLSARATGNMKTGVLRLSGAPALAPPDLSGQWTGTVIQAKSKLAEKYTISSTCSTGMFDVAGSGSGYTLSGEFIVTAKDAVNALIVADYDASGQIVRSLSGKFSSTKQSISLSGIDSHGSKVRIHIVKQ